MHRRVAAFLVLVPIFALPAGAVQDPPWIARSSLGMVASDSAEASRIGAEVLKAGGNAFDAAVATSFALAVARPHSTGLGGGGFMVAYIAKNNRFVALDFRETAPAGATAERYARLASQQGDGPSASLYGGNAVAVPGQLAGLAEINRSYGSRPVGELIGPAIELAETGFVVDEHYVKAAADTLRLFIKHPDFRERFAEVNASLLGDGSPPDVGDTIRQPKLATALRLIRANGPAVFYEGEIAEATVRSVQAAGGPLTTDDLRDYRVKQRDPLRVAYGDFEIVSMPPPSSGGVCIAETLNILQACSLRSDLHPERDGPHVLIEALKHAFADRARWLGDPDFTELPIERMLDPKAAFEAARRIHPRRPTDTETYGVVPPPDDRGTSHFCVVDSAGNVVSLTETINGAFGSFVVAEPFGILLNNEMDDFLTVAGETNLYGLVQGQANLVAPGKRPLSSMSPTIVLKDGRPVLALGGSGGPRIISSVLQVMLNVIEHEQSLRDAIAAVRVHHQWKPDRVYFDRPPTAELADLLREHGHQLSDERRIGYVQAIQILPDGTLIGASDPRKDGRPAGVD